MSDLPLFVNLRRFLPVRPCLLVLALLGLLPLRLRAQIIDDSTRVLYGAKTTRVLYEADILREQYEGRVIDTTLTNIQQQRTWFHDSTYQQDLGNVGTASRRLLWHTNTELGARLGRTVFDKYTRPAAALPFYDTKSPYTFFRYNQSSAGEQVFELSYSRSIGKRINLGAVFERFGSNKILNTNGREGLVEHNNVRVFLRYQSQDDRYHALASFGTSRHRAAEQGGILPNALLDSLPKDLFGYDRENVRLTLAINRDDRDQGRLVHTYRLLGRGLTVYHVLDYSRQLNKFTDTFANGTGDALFYPPFPLQSTTGTDDRAELRQLENTAGLLGRTDAVEYRLYARYRQSTLATRTRVGDPGVLRSAFRRSQFTTLPDSTFGQLFVGGTASFRYRSLLDVQTAGELKPSASLSQTEYWLRATARLGPLTGELLNSSYAPTLTQQQFSGNHYQWPTSAYRTDFNNTNVQQLTARLDQKLGAQRFGLSGSVVNIVNLVYFDQTARPAQLPDAKQLLIGTLRHRFQLGHLFTDNEATYTYSADERGVRLPRLVTNSKVYYQSYIFKKALFSQVGVELYYQSQFRGYAYSPSTQQFYLQDAFTIRSYPLADVYLNTDIKTVSLFLKMAYVNQFLGGQDGYFASPYYTGLPRRFQFGIRWQFFD
ncbi:putative porin [Hymenobacter algoricola]|uniref:Porin n=1 Tax=Hymenobacter algoricola TaxID=486267 RepID=A0ABP7NNV6_9BACT